MSPSTFKHIILLFLFHICDPVHTCPSLCYCNSVMVDCYDRGLEEIPEGINSTAVYVNMKNNRIKAIAQERLSHLLNIENLRLGNNQITALQSGSFVNMSNLKQLDLSHNAISEIEPGAFQNLPKIKVLRLSENQLQEIGNFLSDLPSLERLDLSSNKLLRISDETFINVGALNYLSLAGNQITAISKSTFANLTLLSHLDLSRNPLKNVDSIWNGLSKLSSLHLYSCQLTKVPLDLPRTIGYLMLSNNSLTSISADDFSQTKYLHDIYLNDNDIQNIQDNAFAHCPYLDEIRLDNNNLRILPKPIPASVTRFSADSNEIQRVFQFNFDHDSKMVFLSLKNNSIGALVANTFSRMAELRYLYLDSNNITVMYQMTYSRLRLLRTLSLNSNPIQEVEKRGLGGLHALSKLSLSGIKGHINGVKDDMFHDVPSVQNLDLQGSPYLTALILNDTNVLQGLRSIRYLNLMNNNLTKLDDLLRTWLPKLRSISLMQNPWRCDGELVPLRKWMDESPRTFVSRKNLICLYPDFLKGKPIVNVAIDLFTATTTMSTTTVSVTTPILSTQYDSNTTSGVISSRSVAYISSSGTAFISTTGRPPVKTTPEQRSTLAPPLTRGSTGNSFKPSPRISYASSVDTEVPTPSTTEWDSQKKTSQTKLLPTQTTNTQTTLLRTSFSKAKTTTTAGAQTNSFTSSPEISSTTTTKTVASSWPSTETTTFPGSSVSSSEKLMTSSMQPTTKLVSSSTSTTRIQTATTKSAITKAPLTQSRSFLTTTKTMTRKTERNLTSTPYYVASTPTKVGTDSSNKTNNETASQRTNTPKSDQSRLLTATSSSMNGKTKAIVIGTSVSLVCISIGIIILIVVLRYRKHKKSITIDHNDFHPYQRHEDSSSDTVGIVGRMYGTDVVSGTGKSTDNTCSGHQANSSLEPAAVGNKSRSFRPGSSSRFGMACFSSQSHDDSEMLVYSWDEPNKEN